MRAEVSAHRARQRDGGDVLLRLDGVSVAFGRASNGQFGSRRHGLAQLPPLEFSSGTVTVILGRNATGKTTLLNFIMGFYRAGRRTGWEKFLTWLAMPETDLEVNGRIMIDDVDVTQHPPHARPVGLVMQRFSLYPHLTARNNILFPLRRTSRNKSAQAIIEAASKFADLGSGERLADILKRRPHALSGGQQQRIAIAKLFVRQPKVALFDEAFAHLDRQTQLELWRNVKLNAKQATFPHCVLFVTHDLWHAKDADVQQIIVLGEEAAEHFVFRSDDCESAFAKFAKDRRCRSLFNSSERDA